MSGMAHTRTAGTRPRAGYGGFNGARARARDRVRAETGQALVEMAGTETKAFPLLARENTYTHASPGVCDKCAQDADVRAAWADLLLGQLPSHRVQAKRSEAMGLGAVRYADYEKFEELYEAWLVAMKQPSYVPPEPPTLLWMVAEKERLVAQCGLGDTFAAMKSEEGAVALAMYPELVSELDHARNHAAPHDDGVPEELALALACCLAGNLFDAGAAQLLASETFCDEDECEISYDEEGAPGLVLNQEKVAETFRAARAYCERGAWRFDDAAALASRLGSTRRAIIFCDNAGADTMGMVLFARTLLGLMDDGAVVALAANSEPALNDVTFAELCDFVERARKVDDVLDAHVASGRLALLPTGQNTTLLDLGSVSDELHAWTTAELGDCPEPEDWLVVLDGMGRSLESNWNAFQYVAPGASVLSLAMIKSEINAERLRANVKDCVVRLRRGGEKEET